MSLLLVALLISNYAAMVVKDTWPNGMIFHQPRFLWSKGISLATPPFGVRSCEVTIIWPEGIPRFCSVTSPIFSHHFPLVTSVADPPAVCRCSCAEKYQERIEEIMSAWDMLSKVSSNLHSPKPTTKTTENRPFAPKGSRIVFQPPLFKCFCC